MAFVSDLETHRVFDPGRGYELLTTTGGSDGRLGRKLVGRSGECTFDSYLRIRDANPVERIARPEIEKTGVWRLCNAGPPLPELTIRQTYEVLREAVLAERLSERHDEVNWSVLIPTDLPPD